jgi:hypothetical protein
MESAARIRMAMRWLSAGNELARQGVVLSADAAGEADEVAR